MHFNVFLIPHSDRQDFNCSDKKVTGKGVLQPYSTFDMKVERAQTVVDNVTLDIVVENMNPSPKIWTKN